MILVINQTEVAAFWGVGTAMGENGEKYLCESDNEITY